MKNITTSIDDDLRRQARDVSVETEFQRLACEEQELRVELDAKGLGLNPAHNLTRNELHDRHALR